MQLFRKPLLCAGLICLALWLSAPSFSQTKAELKQDRFHACRMYAPQIARAVQRRFPRGFQHPKAWTAQLYQESLCDLNAVSPVGAKGIAQIMDPTARDIARALGADFDAFSPMAIDYGAYYQARQMRVFKRRGRSDAQTWPLGLAAYNSGLGSVLKAQRKCANARLWPDIAPCQHLVTGQRNANETRTYVTRIQRFRLEMEHGL